MAVQDQQGSLDSLDSLPISEVLGVPASECALGTMALPATARPRDESQLQTKPVAIQEKAGLQPQAPTAIATRFPDVRFHSTVGNSVRYTARHDLQSGAEYSIVVAPQSTGPAAANSPSADDGFGDMPELAPQPEDSQESFESISSEEGFSDLPVLTEGEPSTMEQPPEYPSAAFEACMLRTIGATLGATVEETFSSDGLDFVIARLPNGIRLRQAVHAAQSIDGKLSLVLSLLNFFKEVHAAGFALDGSTADDFLVESGKTVLANLATLVPLAGSGNHKPSGSGRHAPELKDGMGDRSLGTIMFTLGQVLHELSPEIEPTPKHGHGSQAAHSSPEQSRLLGSLLAENPSKRLGRYQELGVDETWRRAEEMVTDWIRAASRPTFKSAGRTSIGVYRENNEDSYAIVSSTKRGVGPGRHLLLAVVSDGMGGGAVGEIASTITVESLARSYRHSSDISADIGVSSLSSLPEGGFTDLGAPAFDAEKQIIAMTNALIRAHHDVREAADKGGESCGGMGATAVAVHLSEWNAVIGHVGDSRAYLVRNGSIRQLTTDHSAVQKMVSMGLISRQEAENHARRHELSQAIGGFEVVVPDVVTLELKSGDRLLLCSDGVTNVIDDETLQHYLNQANDADSICCQIISAANMKASPDNATALVVQVD